MAVHRYRGTKALQAFFRLSIDEFPFPVPTLGIGMVRKPWLVDVGFTNWMRGILLGTAAGLEPRTGEPAARLQRPPDRTKARGGRRQSCLARLEGWPVSAVLRGVGSQLRPAGCRRGISAAPAPPGRPRKTLGWKTPAEALAEHLRSLHEAGVATDPLNPGRNSRPR